MRADPVLEMALACAGQGDSSDAEALVRFALSTDPDSARGHVILARLRARRGERELAVEELVASARRLAADPVDDPTQLYAMFAAALELDPVRLELHVDLAELQAAHNDVPGAQARLVHLSAIYIDAARHDDARAVLAVASAWDPQSSMAGVIDTAMPIEESIPILLEELEEQGENDVPQPAPAPRRQATICTPTLLRNANGDLLPNQACVPKPAASPRRVAQAQAPVPAPRTARPAKRPSTGRSPAVATSRSSASIRTLRARAHVRAQAQSPSAAGTSQATLASRLRKLGGLPRK